MDNLPKLKHYIDYVEEAGLEPPSGMPVFTKPITSLAGLYNSIIKPKHVDQLDYEVELAVAIASRCKDLSLLRSS